MILRITYKDPDMAIRDVAAKKYVDQYDLPEEIEERLSQLGIEEYLTIEVDTESGHVAVIP